MRPEDLLNFLYLVNQFLLCKYFKSLGGIIENPQKNVYNTNLYIYVDCVDFTNLSLKYFTGRNFFTKIVFKGIFVILNIMGNIVKLSSSFFWFQAFTWSNYRLKSKIAQYKPVKLSSKM